MGKNKQTYTLQIDAEIGNLESKLASVKSQLSSVLNSANVPKGLDKTFEKIEGIIDRVKTKTAQPIDSKAGLTSISKDIDNVQVALGGLLKIVQSINKLPEADRINFLPPEAQQQIERIVTSLDKYTTAVQAAITESEELATAREKLAAAEDKVAAAQAKVNQRQANLDQANADKKAAEDAISIIDARKKKLAELKEEQGKIEEFYSATDADGKKRNRSKKYAEVSMRPQDIKRKIAELEAASAGDEKALQNYRQALKTAKGDVESYVTQLGTANRALREAKGAQEELSKTVISLSQNFEASKPEKLQTAFSALREEAKALGIELEDIGEDYSEQDAAKLINRITELKTEGFDQLTGSVDKSAEEIEDFGNGLKDVKTKVEDGTDALEEMNEAAAQQKAFEDKIKAFLGVAGAAQVLRAAVRDAMATIKELDATMTEMAVVTDLTVGDYWDQLPEYSQRASELGVSINSAYKAATLYYQQGLKTNEVNAISVETLKMAKIANLDAADATNKMTAALRGFNMELNEVSAQRVSDVYSELAAITAADTQEIANAMTKTASIASSAGMEFETTAAFLSQIIETTRESAETAGTAMKTVIARFQELKKAPSEIGEVDGEVVDANAIETALREVEVSLRDSSGQFRELDEVFLELSSKWDSMDKNTQRYIATIAAGSRQQSRFIAMMSDYGRTQELVAAANNSAGASNRQFEKTMDSLRAKMEKLKNAWHEFTMSIMNSELVKFGVDVLTKLLEIVNKATSSLGSLGNSISKILSILTIFKLGKTIFEKLRAPMVSFFADIIKEAGLTGERAGKAAKEGLERSKQSPKPGEEKGTVKFSYDKIGLGFIDSFGEGKKSFSERKNARAELQKLTEPHKAVLKSEKQIRDEQEKIKKLQKQVAEEGQKAWSSYTKGVTQAGQAITGVGIGLSLMGGVLNEMGLEEAGKTFSQFGQFVTIAGSALTALGSVAQVVGPIVAKEGIKILASWWPLLAIGAALAGVIAILVISFKQIQKASPEYKHQEAAKATEQAAEAADKATEAYNALADSFETLGDKYKALDNLVRGTAAWKKEVAEINKEVLKLINEYPELAQFMKSENGVLTIDFETEGPQQVLADYYNRQVVADATHQAFRIEEQEAEKRKGFHELDQSAIVMTQSDRNALHEKNPYSWNSTQDWIFQEGMTENYELTKELALAMYKGQMSTSQGIRDFIKSSNYGKGLTEEQVERLIKDLEKNRIQLTAYGEMLEEEENNTEASFKAMSGAAFGVADGLKDVDSSVISQVENIVNEKSQAYFYKKNKVARDEQNVQWDKDKLSAKQEKELNDLVVSTYGEGYYYKKGKVYNFTGEDIATLTNEQINTMLATQDAIKNQTEAFNTAPTTLAAINSLSSKTATALGKGANEITQSELDKLVGMDGINYLLNEMKTSNPKGYESLIATFGSEEQFKKHYTQLRRDAEFGFSSSKDRLDKIGITDTFKGTTSGAALALTDITEDLTWSGKTGSNFVQAFNKIQGGLSSEKDRREFATQIASMAGKETSLEGWESVRAKLESFGMLNADMEQFLQDIIASSGALYSEKYLSDIGVSNKLYAQYQDAVRNKDSEEIERFHKTFAKWRKDYNIAQSDQSKAEHELINQVIDATVESYEKQISAYEEGANAISEANEKLISSISASIEATRQARENDKTETEISDMRNRLAYLRSDTSGGNALAILELQKEIEEAEENYQDSLIDQSIQKLEDANAKAAEQRETQIQLMRDQLEAYKNSEDIVAAAKAMVDEAVEKLTDGEDIENTALGKLVAPENFTSAFEESSFWNGLREKLSMMIREPEVKIEVEEGNKASGGSSGRGIGPKHATTISVYESGGLADFTGPAWLDGTKSRPEYVLNSAQTERFFSLVDVLERFDTDSAGAKAGTGGDNHFEIEINVDKLENDYDVEQLADKIRRMIYDDATYRNVNVVGLMR